MINWAWLTSLLSDLLETRTRRLRVVSTYANVNLPDLTWHRKKLTVGCGSIQLRIASV